MTPPSSPCGYLSLLPLPQETGDLFSEEQSQKDSACQGQRTGRQMPCGKMGLGLHTEWETLGHFFHSSPEFRQSCLFRVSPLVVQPKYTDKALLLRLVDMTPFLPLATKGLAAGTAVGIAVNSAPALLEILVVTCFEYLPSLFTPTP